MIQLSYPCMNTALSVDWWKASCLNINVSKTRNDSETIPVSFLLWWLMSTHWSVYYSTKYLGAVIDNRPTSEHHIDAVCKKKKSSSAPVFPCKLCHFNVSCTNLRMFYSCFIESVLTFTLTSWNGLLNQKNKNRLQRIVRVCCKVECTTSNDRSQLYKLRVLSRAHSILADSPSWVDAKCLHVGQLHSKICH